jgi:uncharacterized protein YqjF (DUF2071 family)
MKIGDHQRRFLTAEWKNLVMLNYAVDGSLLERFVPPGTMLDKFEGKAYVSLVGFEFNRARLFGISIPFHQAFEEVNLRFYVRRAEKRGVVFFRELVPKSAVAAIARFAFSENYSCVQMSHKIVSRAGSDSVEARFEWGSGVDRCSIEVEAEGPPFCPQDGSLSEFITEHYWGYAAKDAGCLEYEVEHPRWMVRNAKRAEFAGDARKHYGAEFAKILKREPESAFLAAGPRVTVFKGTRIE